MFGEETLLHFGLRHEIVVNGLGFLAGEFQLLVVLMGVPKTKANCPDQDSGHDERQPFETRTNRAGCGYAGGFRRFRSMFLVHNYKFV